MLISFRCVFIRLDTKTIVIYRIDSPIYFDGWKRKIERNTEKKLFFPRELRTPQEIIFNIFAYPYRHEKLFDIIHSETKDCTKTKYFHVSASKRIHFLLFCQHYFFLFNKSISKKRFFLQSCSTMWIFKQKKVKRERKKNWNYIYILNTHFTIFISTLMLFICRTTLMHAFLILLLLLLCIKLLFSSYKRIFHLISFMHLVVSYRCSRYIMLHLLLSVRKFYGNRMYNKYNSKNIRAIWVSSMFITMFVYV